MKRILLFTFIFTLLISPRSKAFDVEVQNFKENVHSYGFDQYYKAIHALHREGEDNPVTIAIFDYGFSGYEKEKGRSIPKDTELLISPADQEQGIVEADGVKNTHGLAMAQILNTYMTNNLRRASNEPKLYLYKADGYDNFKWAINDAIQKHVQIILHSMVIEYGGNFDGRGFYNDLVNQATDAGIIWVNSAGNFGLTTYNSFIDTTKSGWAKIDVRDQIQDQANQQQDQDDQPEYNIKNGLPILCKPSKKQKTCHLRLVLAWNDFKDKPVYGTNENLDLYLYNDDADEIASSTRKQVEKLPDSATDDYTIYPKEIIETDIPRGYSYAKVKVVSDNFSSSRAQFRITADGERLSFPVHDAEESLLNPADNPNVITVGESEGERSSVSVSLDKPEVTAPSAVKGDDGRIYKGSSSAAAVVAASVGLMKIIDSSLTREDVLGYLQNPESVNQSNEENYIPVSAALSVPGVGAAIVGPGNVIVPPSNAPIQIQGGQMIHPKASGRSRGAPPPPPGMFAPPVPIPSPLSYMTPKELNPRFIQTDGFAKDEEEVPMPQPPKKQKHRDYDYESRDRRPRYQDNRQDGRQGYQPQQQGGGAIVAVDTTAAIPAKVLQFGPLRSACFALADVKRVDPCTAGDFIVKSHAALVESTAGLKIAVNYDPITLIPGAMRLSPMDKILIIPGDGQRFALAPRGSPEPPGAVEIFRISLDEYLCALPPWDYLAVEVNDKLKQFYHDKYLDPVNRYFPLSCRPETLTTATYPVSQWNMPIQQMPSLAPPVISAPIASAYPVEPGTQYGGHPQQQLRRNNKDFRMSPPSELTDPEDRDSKDDNNDDE